MEEKIKVLLVDDIEETRHNVKKLLSFASDIQVIGEGSNGLEALEFTTTLKPDIILMDINMPLMDGIEAIEEISLTAPFCSVIVMSVQGEQEYLRRAMSAGARDYLVKPFGSDELISTIRRTYSLESKRKSYLKKDNKDENHLKKQVLTVFSSKGGVGKTTIATNLAAVLTKEFEQKVVIVDLDLQFGDVTLMLNLIPRKTIVELVQEENLLDKDIVSSYLLTHETGIKVLPAPQKPEEAELIKEEEIGKIVHTLKEDYDFVIIDTPPTFQESVLTALDHSNQIYLVTTLDLPTVKNVKLCLDVLDSLSFPREQIKLLINQASEGLGLDSREVQDILGLQASGQIVRDLNIAIGAANRGIPFTISHPHTAISKSIEDVAGKIMGLDGLFLNKKNHFEKKGLFPFLRSKGEKGCPY